MIYVGIKPCGCAVAAVSDLLPRPALEREIGRMYLAGYTIEKRQDETATLRACRCEPRPEPVDWEAFWDQWARSLEV